MTVPAALVMRTTERSQAPGVMPEPLATR